VAGPAPRREPPAEHLAARLRALGVRAGGVLLVHASFRALRPVEGGPGGVIRALRSALGPEGTLAMPSWTGDDDAPWDARSTPASPDLGALAEAFRRLPGVARSDHPFALAALGPRAEEVVAGPLPLPPHGPGSPIGRVHDLDGQVLLLGVGHDANTTVHLAEALARVPYRAARHCTVMRGGAPVRIDYDEPDHCCERFGLLDGWLGARGLQSEGPVGHAHARLVRARDVVSAALDALARDPLVFLHPAGAGCAECDAARASAAGG
jgi:aminoglycoside 3-N-acetyltransferase